MLARDPVLVCVASAAPEVRENARAALGDAGLHIAEAEDLDALLRMVPDGHMVVLVDPALPGLGDAPMALLRAQPALHRCAILLLGETDLAALRAGGPLSALVALSLRVHAQVGGDAQLDLLQSVSDEITGSPDAESTMHAVLEAIAGRLDIDTATLFMLADPRGADGPVGHGDPTAGAMVEARAAWGYELETAQLRRVPAGEGVVGWVISRRVPTIVGDSDLDARFSAPGGRSSRSMLAVPVLFGHRVLGALTLVRRAPKPQFTDGDLVLVATIGTSAGIALENARLYERERELRDRLAEADHLVGEERRLLAEIQEYDRLYTQVVATVSHELKTPLMSIRGFARMLRDDDLAREEIRDFAGEIHDNSVRLTGYVESVLTEDAVHSGRITLDLEDVSLGEVVEKASRTLSATLGPRHQLVTELPDRLPRARADVARLLQVVVNLMSNAIKYSPDGGRIRVAARAVAEEEVELSVEDEGLGIPEEARERIFERFYRVATPRTRSIGGTGLGLSIVKGLVDLHGGTIRIGPGTDGVGTVVTVTLPRATSPGAGLDDAAHRDADQLPLTPRVRRRSAMARLARGEGSDSLHEHIAEVS